MFRMFHCLAVIGVCGLSAGVAQAADLPFWVIDPAQSQLSFEATQQGAAIKGQFAHFTGEISFDPAQPESSHAVIKIDMKSADTKSKDRDSSLKGADFFSAESFPESIYTVSKFEKSDENQYVAIGELEMRGVKHPLNLPLTITFSTDEQGQELASAMGEASLMRLDFGVGQGEWKDTQAIGNEVKISVSIKASKAPSP
ncbi:MAG: YceI family protein [Micavibrio sp.]